MKIHRINSIISSISIALFSTQAFAQTSNTKAEKPNIVFIMADDMAYETIGAFKQLDIDTPNLDKLVKQGTSFKNAYNMGSYSPAVCLASRAMLVTGKSLWDAERADYKQIVENQESWPLQMKKAGYDTYISGKWHIESETEKHFDHSAHIRAGMPETLASSYNRPLSPEDYEKGWKPWDTNLGGFWKGGKHWSVVTADDSVDFIEKSSKKDNPFFLYLSFNAPHDPRQAPKEYIDQYPLDRVTIPESFQPEHPFANQLCGKKLRDERLMPYPRTEYAVKVNRQEYFAIISHLDAQIGRILTALEASGKMDNTYIFFTSDHGLAVGHHGLCGKQNLYEHSLRVPFMVVGPNIPKEKVIDTPIYYQDIAPTTIALTGSKAPDSYYYKNILPLIEDPSKPHHKVILGAYMNRQQSIMKDGWKLIFISRANTYELYNLNKDPSELKDLSQDAAHAGKKQELITLLGVEHAKLNPPVPKAGNKKGKGKKGKNKK